MSTNQPMSAYPEAQNLRQRYTRLLEDVMFSITRNSCIMCKTQAVALVSCLLGCSVPAGVNQDSIETTSQIHTVPNACVTAQGTYDCGSPDYFFWFDRDGHAYTCETTTCIKGAQCDVRVPVSPTSIAPSEVTYVEGECQ